MFGLGVQDEFIRFIVKEHACLSVRRWKLRICVKGMISHSSIKT